MQPIIALSCTGKLLGKYVRDGVWNEVGKKVSTYKRVRKEEGKEKLEQAPEMLGLEDSHLTYQLRRLEDVPQKVVGLQFFTVL